MPTNTDSALSTRTRTLPRILSGAQSTSSAPRSMSSVTIGVEVAVIVAAEGEGDQDGDASDEQCQAYQPADAGEDDPDHAACGPVRSGPRCARRRVRGPRFLAAVRHRVQPTLRESFVQSGSVAVKGAPTGQRLMDSRLRRHPHWMMCGFVPGGTIEARVHV